MLFIVLMFLLGLHVITVVYTDGSNISKLSGPDTCPVIAVSHNTYTSCHTIKDSSGGGWDIPHNLSNLTGGPCNIKKVNWTLSQNDFILKFAYTEPVILVGITHQSEFRFHSSREKLLSKYGQELITVTTADTYSSPKAQMTLQHYVEQIMRPQTLGRLGSDTLYHFGDNDREGWRELFSLYRIPPYPMPGLEPVLSFGLAGPGTGVPFHIHGPTFAETIYRRKRWFLYPPNDKPLYNPSVSTLDWLQEIYPDLPQIRNLKNVFFIQENHKQLLSKYGQELITVTTADTYSSPKAQMTLQHYIEQIMRPQTLGRLGSDTLYHFGDNDREGWQELFSLYHLPPYPIPGLEPVLSFGLAVMHVPSVIMRNAISTT